MFTIKPYCMPITAPGRKREWISFVEIALIVVLACVPLFVTFPYRVNIFLSWEGAYRMSEGQMPFRDFGTPLGGMYWTIPAIFFKIFGSQLITLVKAQVFINIISGIAFRSIMMSIGINPWARFASLLTYCLSYSFFNFWPWYNHTVIVYEFIAFAFLLKVLLDPSARWKNFQLVLSAFFLVCSFFTKQDAGGMAILLAILFISYKSLILKNWKSAIIYFISIVVIMLLFILPMLKYDLGYWFNHGQAPHTARVSAMEIVSEFFGGSLWIKFYLALILIISVLRFSSFKSLWIDQREMLFLLLTLGILGEALIFGVTSYTPPDNNIFYHSFAIAYLLYSLHSFIAPKRSVKLMLTVSVVGVLLWWSGVYWKYFQRLAARALPENEATVSSTGENIVNRKTFMINTSPVDTTDVGEGGWVFSDLPSFKNIYMPPSTVRGINRLLAMDVVKNKAVKVLNMSELTPLAAEIPYALERGSHYPLWNHLGVGMFNKQAEMFEGKVSRKEYDLILFEYIPNLNNFYPFRVRDSIRLHYKMVDEFEAPRRGETRGKIEVYIK